MLFRSCIFCNRVTSQLSKRCSKLQSLRKKSYHNEREKRRIWWSLGKKRPLEDLIMPVNVELSNRNDFENTEGFSGVEQDFGRSFISYTLEQFIRKPIIQELAEQNYLTGKLFRKAFESFRRYCLNTSNMDSPLRITFSDIKNQNHSVDLLFPYFLLHARKVFPHLDCMEELKQISDLTQPHNWYPLARELHRKIIFHAGPTNSGKTYSALERFRECKSGLYSGPLRLLATEIFYKMNELGLNCDLITGEDRRFALPNNLSSNHLSSTVEMLSLEKEVEVAIIDEIQMVRDEQRGYAFTRALLGVAASEVHLCGEEAAVDVICRILDPIGEHVEIQRYERMSPLLVSTHGLRDLKNVEPGDCIICFSKQSIFSFARQLKSKCNLDSAIIYGDLPPATKLAEAAKFNDPDDACKVLIATDAIGMGLNLNIKRIIFSVLTKGVNGNLLPAYFARQIAGRAGRFGLSYNEGKVMAMTDEDNIVLRSLLNERIEDISRAGVSPNFEQIEMFSMNLPHCSFTNLLDIFVSICSVSDDYFVCMTGDIRQLAELIENISLTLRDRYTFCLVPLKVDRKFLRICFVKIVRRYSDGLIMDFEFLHGLIKNLMVPARKVEELNNLSDAFDVVGAYLWFSYRFPEYFPDVEAVRSLENDLDELFRDSIEYLVEHDPSYGCLKRKHKD